MKIESENLDEISEAEMYVQCADHSRIKRLELENINKGKGRSNYRNTDIKINEC